MREILLRDQHLIGKNIPENKLYSFLSKNLFWLIFWKLYFKIMYLLLCQNLTLLRWQIPSNLASKETLCLMASEQALCLLYVFMKVLQDYVSIIYSLYIWYMYCSEGMITFCGIISIEVVYLVIVIAVLLLFYHSWNRNIYIYF